VELILSRTGILKVGLSTDLYRKTNPSGTNYVVLTLKEMGI
jgi:hypothetical protein